MPEVSVIMAAYNAEEYIMESINSIINQDFQNFEIIICDDASTDSTWEKISYAMELDKRVIGIRNDNNLKAAATRNNCLSIAKGNYVAIQDSDDISEPERLSRQLKTLKENPNYTYVGTGMYLFDSKGTWKKTTPIEYPKKTDYLKGAPYAHGTTMFKKSALLSVGGYRVAKETQRGQDADLLMRLYSNGFIGRNLLDYLYGYRVDGQTLKRRKFKFRYHSFLNRYKNYKEMGLMPIGIIYAVKPLIGGLIPRTLMYKMRKRK